MTTSLTTSLRAAARQVGWLASGTPPSRIGWSPGPLTALRLGHQRARHRLSRSRRTLCLLEHNHGGAPQGPAVAFWLSRRSRHWHAEVNGDPRRADLVWVFSEDPLDGTQRARLQAQLEQVPPGVRVLNPVHVYDAYHAEDCFARLACAGVSVPRSRFGPRDVGRTEVVYKEAGTQGGRKIRAVYDGPRPGYRAFTWEDGRGADGLVRRYRAFYVAGAVLSETVIVACSWEARLSTLVDAELTFELTRHEVEQVRLLAATLGLDSFAVDFLRRVSDGAPVFVDVNVYPTQLISGWVPADRGAWHFFDLPARLARPWPGGVPYWQLVDEALLQAASRPRQ